MSSKKQKYFIWPLSLTGSRTNIAMLLRLSTLFYLFAQITAGDTKSLLTVMKLWETSKTQQVRSLKQRILTPLL